MSLRMGKKKEADAQPAQDHEGVENGKIKKKSTSRSAKAGLTLSVSRVHRELRESGAIDRIGMGAPVFLTAVLEYVVTEVISLAAESTTESKRKRIMPEDISHAIRSDPELHKLLEGFRIFTGDKFRPTELAHEITCKEDVERKKADKAAKLAAKAKA